MERKRKSYEDLWEADANETFSSSTTNGSESDSTIKKYKAFKDLDKMEDNEREEGELRDEDEAPISSNGVLRPTTPETRDLKPGVSPTIPAEKRGKLYMKAVNPREI